MSGSVTMISRIKRIKKFMTIYLFAIEEERRFDAKQIHKFAIDYLRPWFLKLGFYTAFSNIKEQTK